MFTLFPVVVALKTITIKKWVNLPGGKMIRKTSYCQGCIRTEVPLTLTEAEGKPFWLCGKCMNPLPRESYTKNDELESRKAWGDSKYENKG